MHDLHTCVPSSIFNKFLTKPSTTANIPATTTKTTNLEEGNPDIVLKSWFLCLGLVKLFLKVAEGIFNYLNRGLFTYTLFKSVFTSEYYDDKIF